MSPASYLLSGCHLLLSPYILTGHLTMVLKLPINSDSLCGNRWIGLSRCLLTSRMITPTALAQFYHSPKTSLSILCLHASPLCSIMAVLPQMVNKVGGWFSGGARCSLYEGGGLICRFFLLRKNTPNCGPRLCEQTLLCP
jgi:hypothetical protein